MLKPLFPSALLALSALACSSSSLAEGPAGPAATNAADFRYQKALTATTRVEMRDLNGAIHVEPASGDTFEVVAIKSGRREDFARVQVVVREEAGTIVVCAVWPGQDPATCHAGVALSGSSEDNVKVRVELRVRIPSKVIALAAHTLNGAIDAQSPAGDVDLHTLNGSIDVTARGAITAETLNGHVTARADAGKAVRLATNNGKVEVSLPAASDADVQASTTNGRVSSDFGDVPAPSIRRLHDVKLRLGAGGTAISLRTMNGDVLVRRAGS